MNNEEKKQLIKSQQGELDAVLLYKKLSEILKEVEHKETFLKIASDEGRHAAIIRKYTNENLKPKNLKTVFVSNIYKICGFKFTINMLSKGEFKASKRYDSLVANFPNIRDIIKDEDLHGNLLKNMI